jgi:hypothetical protein
MKAQASSREKFVGILKAQVSEDTSRAYLELNVGVFLLAHPRPAPSPLCIAA